MDEIIGTKSVEFVTDKDRVLDEEMDVFYEELWNSDLKVTVIDELSDAIKYALDKAENGDVVVLAGSQGMDYGARVALEYIFEKHPEKDKERLFAPLMDRVSDMN